MSLFAVKSLTCLFLQHLTSLIEAEEQVIPCVLLFFGQLGTLSAPTIMTSILLAYIITNKILIFCSMWMVGEVLLVDWDTFLVLELRLQFC